MDNAFNMDLEFLYKDRRRADILFLGTHHWKVFGLDKINPDSGDMLTETRQAELDELLDILASYKPTRIVLEFPFKQQQKLSEQYRKFIEGELDIDQEKYVWEGYQIGFKLAKKLRHDTVYGFDNYDPEHTDLPIDEVMAYVQENGPAWLGEVMQTFMGKISETMDKVVNMPLIDNYRHQNSERGYWLNEMFYYVMAEVGEGWDSPGLEVASRWYKRNIDMFTNLSKIIDMKAAERIFVLVGQGHVPHIRDAAIKSPYYTVTPFSDLLPEDS